MQVETANGAEVLAASMDNGFSLLPHRSSRSNLGQRKCSGLPELLCPDLATRCSPPGDLKPGLMSNSTHSAGDTADGARRRGRATGSCRYQYARSIQTAALIGTHMNADLLRSVLDEGQAVFDDCLKTGILLPDATSLRFRHELVRMAVAEAIPPHRKTGLHARLFAVLEEGGRRRSFGTGTPCGRRRLCRRCPALCAGRGTPVG